MRESYDPKDLFNEAEQRVNLIGGTVNVDDSTLDKPYSQKMESVGHFWSGIFASLCIFVHLQQMTLTDLIKNAYR